MLDYTIETAAERCASLHIPEDPTPKQLEQIANYILFGKDEAGKALPEAKTSKTKKSTFKKAQPASLDELMENPLFEESEVNPQIKRSIYLISKPTISRVKDADIENMQELWEAIDQVEEWYKAEENSLKKYYLRHWLIELRKEQYYLKELLRPEIHFLSPIKSPPHETDWNHDCGYCVEPLTLIPKKAPNGREYYQYVGEPNWTWKQLANHTIDLTNSEHILQLLNHYSSVRTEVLHKYPTPTIELIYAELERIIDRTNLTPIRQLILIRKIDGATNEQIAQEVFRIFKVSYGVNYISTIWTKEICDDIAKTAILIKDEQKLRNKPEKWKRCKKCGKLKLRDSREFPKKQKYPDKLAPVCRACKE